MASPFSGPMAVADVIKDLDTQIAVSKKHWGWHAGFLSWESTHLVNLAFGDLNGTRRA